MGCEIYGYWRWANRDGNNRPWGLDAAGMVWWLRGRAGEDDLMPGRQRNRPERAGQAGRAPGSCWPQSPLPSVSGTRLGRGGDEDDNCAGWALAALVAAEAALTAGAAVRWCCIRGSGAGERGWRRRGGARPSPPTASTCDWRLDRAHVGFCLACAWDCSTAGADNDR